MTMKKEKQDKEQNNQAYRTRCAKIQGRLKDYGIALEGEVFILVNLRTVIGVEELKEKVQKVYFKTPMAVPLSVCMQRRAKAHYQNVNEAAKSVYGRVKESAAALSFVPQLLGVLGIARRPEKNTVRLDVDREAEETKVHHPFFGFTALHTGREGKGEEAKDARTYYKEEEIEEKLGLGKGVVHRLTSSFIVGYQTSEREEERKERQVVDIGLNLKNLALKCHVPGLVRFVDEPAPTEEEKKETKPETEAK